MGKEKLEIKFTGTEYVEYLKYKKSTHIQWTKENKIIMTIITLTALISMTILGIVGKLTHVDPTPIVYSWEGICMFLAVCAGLAWVLHGFGFILIRR